MEVCKKGLSGSALKWIAIITMLIDHIGAVVLARVLLNYHDAADLSVQDKEYAILYGIYDVTRTIGRLAFPIFCFLLVEGFYRTSNKSKYVARIAIFALLTEVPFDLAFTGKTVFWGYQNVMLTLLIGMLVMLGCHWLEKYVAKRQYLLWAGQGICVVAGMLVAWLLHTDYSFKGIICIMVLYFFRSNRIWQCMAGALSVVWEAEAMFSFLFIYIYNGQRGRQTKYFFYIFYPAHLLLLYWLSYLLKIHWIPVVS